MWTSFTKRNTNKTNPHLYLYTLVLLLVLKRDHQVSQEFESHRELTRCERLETVYSVCELKKQSELA